MPADDTLSFVIKTFEDRRGSSIDGILVRGWIESDQDEVLGAVYQYVTEDSVSTRIDPPLERGDFQRLLFRYGERCLRRATAGEYAASRYDFGRELVRWIRSLWVGPEAERQSVGDWKEWLAHQYIEGSSEVRRCLVDATLEHLFETPTLQTFFDDWKSHPVLGRAYEEADEWARFFDGRL